MTDALLAASGTVIVAALVGGFIAVALWETLAPLRPGTVPTAGRWQQNIALLALNHGLLWAALPLLPLAAAVQARTAGTGLLPRLELPFLADLVVGLLALDALRWLMHRAFHRLPWLWRLHRVHHSDLDYDCTIALRFHPLEALIAGLAIVAGVLALGASPLTVLLSEAATAALGAFAHANASLPPRAERLLRRWLVTPDVHRVHHSTDAAESMSNFGSVLSLWDRLAGCFRDAPAAGMRGMSIGLAECRDPTALRLRHLLAMPFGRPGANTGPTPHRR